MSRDDHPSRRRDAAHDLQAMLNASHATGVADTVARLHAVLRCTPGVDSSTADALLERFDELVREQIAQLDVAHRVPCARRFDEAVRDALDGHDPL